MFNKIYEYIWFTIYAEFEKHIEQQSADEHALTNRTIMHCSDNFGHADNFVRNVVQAYSSIEKYFHK